ncbi:hypothetical protein O0L34_g10748 [Tuta absoluta]|nr:hypothetical protein O0L34_g10748 [Tuta absoluta]
MDRSNPSYLNANYKCEKCVFGFKEDGCYMEHLNKHEIWYGPMVCSVCELRFKDMESLENHRKSHLIGFFCTQCSFASRFLQSVSAHYKREHRPPADHCCHKCDAVFSSEVELLSHLELGHGKPTCIQCGDTFRNLHQLKLHVQKVHDKLMFPCPVCGKQFNCDTSVKQHVKLVHDKKLEPVQDPRFYCKQCDKFFQQYTYKIHLKTSKAHVGDNFKFECSECTQKFATQPRLRMHVERVHLHVTNAACDICGQKCYNMIALRKHVKSRHTPKQDADRTHICNVCGKGFFNPTILSHHLLTHTGEKPYRCPHCHHRAAQKSTILTHCKYKHKELPAIKYSDLHKVT